MLLSYFFSVRRSNLKRHPVFEEGIVYNVVLFLTVDATNKHQLHIALESKSTTDPLWDVNPPITTDFTSLSKPSVLYCYLVSEGATVTPSVCVVQLLHPYPGK
uniref:Leptin receptor n=1 Tax=Engystomops pustulosus TaxID=76066 RepID=A0AAV6YIM6_ENGPU|nr:hypothetical protein GDO81_025297 [Engystomops pustulosus]